MMKRHTVTEDEMRKWIETEVWHIAAASHGQGSNKRLEMSNTGIFVVTDHKEETYRGTELSAAITAYNNAA